jgi:hypothetical protein
MLRLIRHSPYAGSRTPMMRRSVAHGKAASAGTRLQPASPPCHTARSGLCPVLTRFERFSVDHCHTSPAGVVVHRSGSSCRKRRRLSPQVIDPMQDLGEQRPWHRHLGHHFRPAGFAAGAAQPSAEASQRELGAIPLPQSLEIKELAVPARRAVSDQPAASLQIADGSDHHLPHAKPAMFWYCSPMVSLLARRQANPPSKMAILEAFVPDRRTRRERPFQKGCAIGARCGQRVRARHAHPPSGLRFPPLRRPSPPRSRTETLIECLPLWSRTGIRTCRTLLVRRKFRWYIYVSSDHTPYYSPPDSLALPHLRGTHRHSLDDWFLLVGRAIPHLSILCYIIRHHLEPKLAFRLRETEIRRSVRQLHTTTQSRDISLFALL